jgi:Resolvase, N terminal domain
VRFKWTNTLPRENALFWGLWDKGFNWDGLQRFIAGYQRPTKHCARLEPDLRAFAKKAGYKIVGVWKEIASGARQERAERKKVLALAQARKVDVILVTELTSWGRSVLSVL